MARPPKYTTEDTKPVGISLRLPRELYDQARRHAAMRGTTLTELVVEGLQMRLETPTDPRDILVIRDDTVMQELKQMITAEVQAVLAAQAIEAPKPARPRKTARKSRTQQYRNTTSEHTYAPEPGQSLVTEPARTRPAPGQYKLTARQAAQLRAKRQRGTPIKALMEEYGISKATLFRYLKET